MKFLVRWQPLQELTSLQQQMNHLFDSFFGRTQWMPFEENVSAWEFGPPADIYEDDQKLTFRRKERHYGAFSRSFTLPTTG